MHLIDRIIRSNRKTLAVSIDRFGVVTVRAPKRYTDERIFSFVNEKQDWILRKKAQMKGAGMALPTENLDGYAFLLFGKMRTIRLCDEKKVRINDDELFVPNERSRERLLAWLKENAKRILLQVTQEKAKEMGVSVSAVRISSAKTRWGSCSAKNAISYSFRLLYAPKEVVEYVVYHELAHIRQRNHSKKFWAEVERYCPNWKDKRKWLKDHAFAMEIF